MKWQPVKTSYRLFFGFMGLFGLLFGALTLSYAHLLEKQPLSTLIYLVIAAMGLVLFLFIAIVGKFPDAEMENRGTDHE